MTPLDPEALEKAVRVECMTCDGNGWVQSCCGKVNKGGECRAYCAVQESCGDCGGAGEFIQQPFDKVEAYLKETERKK